MSEREVTRDPENDKDPAAIERDIDRTRASLGRTVDALESRLSPGELLDQALGMARQHGGEFATNLGRSVRNNPMPVILTGVGLAWMMASSNEPRAASYTASYEDWTSPNASASKTRHRLKSGMSSAKSAAGAVGDTAARATDTVRQSVDSLGDRASETKERMRMHSERVRYGFESLMEEQPLLVGAIGLAVGAALGAALPRTESEDRLLGETSDSAVRSMKDKAAEAYEEVKDTAAEVVASTRDRADTASDDGQQAPLSTQETSGQRTRRGSADTEWQKGSRDI
jgi:ElaB/YqjD/DUF883 family membrane-anchored ribosome-binding protein